MYLVCIRVISSLQPIWPQINRLKQFCLNNLFSWRYSNFKFEKFDSAQANAARSRNTTESSSLVSVTLMSQAPSFHYPKISGTFKKNIFSKKFQNPSLYIKEQSPRRKFEIKSFFILKNGPNGFLSLQVKNKKAAWVSFQF